MKKKQSFIFIIIALLFLFNLAQADFFITKEELRNHGIDYDNFEPIDISEDGKLFAGLQGIQDKATRAKGFVCSLVVMRLRNQKLVKVDNVLLPVVKIVNATLNTRLNAVYVMGNYGTKFLKIDLDKLEVETIFEYEENKPGFKGESFLYSYKKGVFATGYFYDNERCWLGDYLVRVVEKDGKCHFVKKVRLDKLFGKYKPKAFVNAYFFVSGETIYFNLIKIKEKQTHLMAYRKGRTSSIDKSWYLGIFAGSDDRVYYRLRDQKNYGIHIYKDLKSGQKWQIGEKGNITYTYPFISYRGDILIVSTLDVKAKKTSYYIGKERNNFKLEPLLKNVMMAPMKFAKTGKVYAYLPNNGIKIGYID